MPRLREKEESKKKWGKERTACQISAETENAWEKLAHHRGKDKSGKRFGERGGRQRYQSRRKVSARTVAKKVGMARKKERHPGGVPSTQRNEKRWKIRKRGNASNPTANLLQKYFGGGLFDFERDGISVVPGKKGKKNTGKGGGEIRA